MPVELNILGVDRSNFLLGYEITDKMLSRYPNCDGVYYTSDMLAYGGLQYLREHGVLVPKDISVVGMDDLPLSGTFNLTTVRQDTDRLGRQAARSIIDLIENRPVQRQHIVPVSLVKRGTV